MSGADKIDAARALLGQWQGMRFSEDEKDLFAALADLADAQAQEIERLRYVLKGVRGAINTGRNEPLMIWRDQISIALGETP